MIGTLGTMTPYNKKEPAPAGKGLTETLSETSTPSDGGRRRVKVTRRRHPSMAFSVTPDKSTSQAKRGAGQRQAAGTAAAESPEGEVVSESAVYDSGGTEDTAVEAAGSTTSGPLDMLKKLPLYAKLGLAGGLLYLIYFVMRRKG
jgi:hypothetical protein